MAYQINTGRPIAKIRKPAKDEPYLKWIRLQPCVVCRTRWNVEAAHTRQDGEGGMGTKTGGDSCIPLCQVCHRHGTYAYHRFGDEAKWAEHHGLKLDEIKADLRERYVTQ